MLKRFRTAYDYLDAVIHGVEPADIEDRDERPSSAPAQGQSEQPAYGSSPAPAPANPEPEPQTESRPTWP
jgi:hypothetical protein